MNIKYWSFKGFGGKWWELNIVIFVIIKNIYLKLVIAKLFFVLKFLYNCVVNGNNLIGRFVVKYYLYFRIV